MGQRLVVMDVQESFHFVRYKARENQLVVFADDINIRYVLRTFLSSLKFTRHVRLVLVFSNRVILKLRFVHFRVVSGG